MEFRHTSVLLSECIDSLNIKPDGIYAVSYTHLRAEEGLDFEIEIDGGITLDNVKEVTDAGVSVVVAGSSVFGASDIEARVREFVKW